MNRTLDRPFGSFDNRGMGIRDRADIFNELVEAAVAREKASIMWVRACKAAIRIGAVRVDERRALEVLKELRDEARALRGERRELDLRRDELATKAKQGSGSAQNAELLARRYDALHGKRADWQRRFTANQIRGLRCELPDNQDLQGDLGAKTATECEKHILSARLTLRRKAAANKHTISDLEKSISIAEAELRTTDKQCRDLEAELDVLPEWTPEKRAIVQAVAAVPGGRASAQRIRIENTIRYLALRLDRDELDADEQKELRRLVAPLIALDDEVARRGAAAETVRRFIRDQKAEQGSCDDRIIAAALRESTLIALVTQLGQLDPVFAEVLASELEAGSCWTERGILRRTDQVMAEAAKTEGWAIATAKLILLFGAFGERRSDDLDANKKRITSLKNRIKSAAGAK